MGGIASPAPVKLICGLLSGSESLLASAREALAREYGPVDLASQIWPFNWTEYYRDEMGQGLLRQFLAFERLILPDEIAAIKVRTNELEEELKVATPQLAMPSAESAGTTPNGPGLIIPRPINLDPGYLAEGKLVLASTKDFSHRIYLSRGVFAEVTLNYVHGRWQGHASTFPDYASGAYDAFLTEARSVLRRQLGKKERKS